MDRLVSLFGLFCMIGLAWAISSNRSKFPWRVVVGGVGLQCVLALIMLTEPLNEIFFSIVEVFFKDWIESFVRQGAGFLFNFFPNEHIGPDELPPGGLLLNTFAMSVLPTIIFFSALMSVLYYLGIVQVVVVALAWLMQKTLKVSGAESLAAAANVFVGHTEAPLVVKPYILGMTKSELNAMMVGGFATISGGLLAVYASMGIHPGHLLTASIISAPAALLIAKVMLPESETSQTMGHVSSKIERQGTNVIEAAAIGASDGMKLALNVAAMLIAFLALIHMADTMIAALGRFGIGWLWQSDPQWSLNALLGYLFQPLAFLIGIEAQDCRAAGQLLGIKTLANEFLAYDQLGKMKAGADGVPQISARTEIIMTYALSGFSNFGAIGIQIGGIGGLVPERRADLAKLGLRAMFGGMLACCMTACIAGAFLPIEAKGKAPVEQTDQPETENEEQTNSMMRSNNDLQVASETANKKRKSPARRANVPGETASEEMLAGRAGGIIAKPLNPATIMR